MIQSRSPGTVLWLLLAAALFMRAVVPQGYMPERADSGAITVRVCGSGHVLLIPTGNGDAPVRSERAEPPCAFAGLGTPVLPPPPITGLPAPEAVELAFVHGRHLPLRIVTALPHPPARGPPLAA